MRSAVRRGYARKPIWNCMRRAWSRTALAKMVLWKGYARRETATNASRISAMATREVRVGRMSWWRDRDLRADMKPVPGTRSPAVIAKGLPAKL